MSSTQLFTLPGIRPVHATAKNGPTEAARDLLSMHRADVHGAVYERLEPYVSEGRAALNFSEWQRPQEEAKEAAEEVVEGEMTLRMYQLMQRMRG